MLFFRLQNSIRDFRDFQNFQGTDNDDNISGTNNADFFDMSQNGTDICKGKGGSDTFFFGPTWNIDDRVDGGSGNDTLELSQGDTVLLGKNGLTSVETIYLRDNGDYTITFIGAGAGVTDHVTMDGSDLKSSNFLTVDAGNEKGRSVTLIGGASSDHLTGGQVDDELRGNAGLDFIDGEKGADVIICAAVSDSTGIKADHVTFKQSEDVFRLPDEVTGVDELVRGKLNGPNHEKFDANLENTIGSDELGANHAVVLNVIQGLWSNHVFLIVDANGSAGYQAGADFVFDMYGNGLGEIDTSNFVT